VTAAVLRTAIKETHCINTLIGVNRVSMRRIIQRGCNITVTYIKSENFHSLMFYVYNFSGFISNSVFRLHGVTTCWDLQYVIAIWI